MGREWQRHLAPGVLEDPAALESLARGLERFGYGSRSGPRVYKPSAYSNIRYAAGSLWSESALRDASVILSHSSGLLVHLDEIPASALRDSAPLGAARRAYPLSWALLQPRQTHTHVVRRPELRRIVDVELDCLINTLRISASDPFYGECVLEGLPVGVIGWRSTEFGTVRDTLLWMVDRLKREGG